VSLLQYAARALTKSLRKYLLPSLLIPNTFCLPPVEYSPGTTPIQAARFRPF